MSKSKQDKVIHAFGVVIDNPYGKVRRSFIQAEAGRDHGCDPVGDGTFRMVPSGDIVDYEERCRRLAYLQRC